MKYKTYPLFKIDIHKFKIQEWKSVKDDILSLIPFDDEKYKKDSIIDFSDFGVEGEKAYQKKFFSMITPYLSDFRTNSEYKFGGIVEVWCQRYFKNNYHPPHDHGPIGYSAVFYAKLDEKVHSSTVFFAPFQSVDGGSGREQSIMVSEGDLIIFPSNLLHMAPAHQSDKERIIISFNLQ